MSALTHVNILLSSAFIQPILWFVCAGIFKKELGKLEGGYDNSNPRSQHTQLSPLGTRALNCHNNLLEGFVWFGFAVVINLQLSRYPTASSTLALIYLLSRLIYVPLFLFNYPSARSLVWGIGFLATLALFLVPFA